MAVMIHLQLPSDRASFATISQLPGLSGLALDPNYGRTGVVCIDPARGYYIVRAASFDEPERRKALSPEIVETFGDLRISTA